MFKRFKEWLIHKCGGYTESDKEKIVEETRLAPREVKHKVFKVPANTVKLSTVIPFTLYDEDLIGLPTKDRFKIISDMVKAQLIEEIGRAIVEKGLYAVEYRQVRDVERLLDTVQLVYTISVNDIHEASIMPWSEDATRSYYSSKHGISTITPLNTTYSRKAYAADQAAWKSFRDEWLQREKEGNTQCCWTPESEKVMSKLYESFGSVDEMHEYDVDGMRKGDI